MAKCWSMPPTASSASEPLHLHDCGQRHRRVDVRERFGRLAELFVHHLSSQQRFVDVQQQHFGQVAVEAFARGGPLGGGARVDEALVGKFDATTRAGVHPLGQ